MMENIVQLGFLQKSEQWFLLNTHFPSKVGGRPAWLDVESIPSNDRLKCPECEKQLTFLCQVYAPLDDHENCFHRTIFVFICKEGSCWKPNITKPIKVFRCQLPRVNEYYKPTPPDENVQADETISSVKLCEVCGCRGPLICAVCRAVNYCSKEHQKLDWTLGKHKSDCNKCDPMAKSVLPDIEKHQYLLEEFEVISEDYLSDSDEDENEEDREARRMKDYEEFMKKHKEKTKDDELANVPDEEFEKYTSQIDDDKVFHKFKKCTMSDPDQVIRFDRNGSPLWITGKNQPKSTDIPPCELCKKPRIFEFQIMPQMLNSFKRLDADWGVLAIYTCPDSCDTNRNYVDEFCYKQDLENVEK